MGYSVVTKKKLMLSSFVILFGIMIAVCIAYGASRVVGTMQDKKDIPIYSTAFLKSPIIVGIWKPCIYLPIHLISDYNTSDYDICCYTSYNITNIGIILLTIL